MTNSPTDTRDYLITNAEWRAFQAIPDQGYSHRGWLDHLIAGRIRKAQADAWDEGFDVGESNGYAIGRDTDAWENSIDNPYREAR